MKMNDLVHNEERLKQLRERAKELIGQMTLEEKVYQTLYNAPAIERLGIASYNWWNEALHGVARAGTATVFPQAIGLAATFDEDFMEQIGDAVSTEARAKFNMQQEFGDHDIYKGLTFWAPNVNIFRDPRWGRGHETFGEDPYLTSRLGVRYIEGMQGHDEKYLILLFTADQRVCVIILMQRCLRKISMRHIFQPSKHVYKRVKSRLSWALITVQTESHAVEARLY